MYWNLASGIDLVKSRQVLPVVVGLRRALWTLTVVLLTLWWHHNWPLPTPSGIRAAPLTFPLYTSDISVAVTLLVWCVERVLRRQPLVLGPRAVACAGVLLVVASATSIIDSLDPALSLAITAHLLLLAGFYLLCVNDPPTPAHVGWLFAALLMIQAVFGLLEEWTQSTASLCWLHSSLACPVVAAASGASIVGAADGGPWLRAYGTLGHPNVLGGMLLVYLGAVIERYLVTGRRPWLLIVAIGTVILFLSFSRAAWAGMAALVAVLLMLRAPGSAGRPRWVLAAIGLPFVLMVLAFWPIVMARVGAAPVPVDPEVRSTSERLALLRVGWAAVLERPLSGLGAGTFTAWVELLPGRPAPIEPIHNVPLLVVAETGLGGVAAWLVLAFGITRRIWRGWRSMASCEAIRTAVLIGILVASMADHYWWTLAPMRTMFVIALALFAAHRESPSADVRLASSGDVGAKPYGLFRARMVH